MFREVNLKICNKKKVPDADLYVFKSGALGAIRTRDLSLKRGVLYLLSYKRTLFNSICLVLRGETINYSPFSRVLLKELLS